MEKKKVVLIADDDPDYLFQTSLALEHIGFEVVKAENRKQAELLLTEKKPDLCIFDLMMESQDSGFVLAYKAKQLYPDLPIIIASAVTSETGMVFKLETNDDKSWIKADLFLEKGIRPDQLEREIHKLLGI
jgi:CheY-like chemotaxis protein